MKLYNYFRILGLVPGADRAGAQGLSYEYVPCTW
jgi:hypothetical protein